MQSGIRQEFAHHALEDLIAQPVSALAGVSEPAAAALAGVDIATIFDLGGSSLFALARQATLADESDGLRGRFGSVPADWLKKAGTVASAGASPLAALKGLDPTSAASLEAALGAKTVGDLAAWPPYLAARALLGESLGGNADTDRLIDDPAADALKPRLGEFPAERVYYDTLVLFGVRGGSDALTGIDDAVPLSLNPVLDEAGFQQIGIGARLSYCQSWRSKGVTLGHLLHSLALAPGEATRVAVLDWTRRTRAATAETIEEREQLDATLSRARTTNEVQRATAVDAQSGFSTANTQSSASSGSFQAAAETGLIPSLWVSGGLSGSTQSSQSVSASQSTSFSQGSRIVVAGMNQRVNDSTEQHATSARARHAAVVREVSQEEHASASTRVVANYNHMHALTIQYWEVVQLYEISTSLTRAERVIFLPVRLPDVTKDETIARFRAAFARAALTPRVQQLLLDEVSSVGIRSVAPPLPSTFKPYSVPHPELMRGGSKAAATAAMVDNSLVGSVAGLSVRAIQSEAVAIAKVFGAPVVKPGSDDNFYPDDTFVIGVRMVGPPMRAIRFDLGGAGADVTLSLPSDQDSFDLEEPIPLVLIDKLEIAKSNDNTSRGNLSLRLKRGPRVVDSLPIPVDLASGTQLQTVAHFYNDRLDRKNELVGHLKANAAHYAQAALRSLDAPSVALLLGGYKLGDEPLARLVDPTPVGVTGNWLVLRAPAADDEDSGLRASDLGVGEADQQIGWRALLDDREAVVKQDPDIRLVPMPTGGVFAEAVLGRSNSAEKLDITRFWNWQDSPIPLTPTDIAPPDLASRGTAENLTPSQLGPPVLSVMQPPAAPDPAGLSAVLGAIASGAMFRDMSGLPGTQAAAQAGQQQAIQAATDAGQIASSNMRTQAQKAVAMAQVAADIVKAVFGGGGGSKASLSEKGADLAHAQSMDRRGVALPAAAAGGAGGTGAARSGSAAPGGGGAAQGSAQPARGASEASAVMAARNQPNLESVGALARELNAIGSEQETALELEQVGSALGYVKEWQDLIQFTPPAQLRASLAQRHVVVQSIYDASGPLNTDLYGVHVRQLPNVGGTAMTPEALLEHIRRNFNSFVDTGLSTFSPLSMADEPLWNSASPVGSVIRIDIEGPDNAAVVTAEHDARHWRFCTVATPFYFTGGHPVSGTREWGVRSIADGIVIYTRGADRATGFGENLLGEALTFPKGDALWRSFQQKVSAYVTANGGAAEIMRPYSQRTPWNSVRSLLGLTRPDTA